MNDAQIVAAAAQIAAALIARIPPGTRVDASDIKQALQTAVAGLEDFLIERHAEDEPMPIA